MLHSVWVLILDLFLPSSLHFRQFVIISKEISQAYKLELKTTMLWTVMRTSTFHLKLTHFSFLIQSFVYLWGAWIKCSSLCWLWGVIDAHPAVGRACRNYCSLHSWWPCNHSVMWITMMMRRPLTAHISSKSWRRLLAHAAAPSSAAAAVSLTSWWCQKIEDRKKKSLAQIGYVLVIKRRFWCGKNPLAHPHMLAHNS